MTVEMFTWGLLFLNQVFIVLIVIENVIVVFICKVYRVDCDFMIKRICLVNTFKIDCCTWAIIILLNLF